jgi:putative lipoprotein (rSAM/lipoprotein system)
MKTVKKSFFRFFDKIIVLLLGVAGMFSACDNVEDMPVEYGMPHADFELKGTVTDKATSQPIQNIRVVRPFGYEDIYGGIPGDTIYTDEDGKYVFAFVGFPSEKYQLKFEDIDGEENGGLFQTKEIEGEFTQADLVEKGNGHWYEGKYVKTQDVALERIETEAPLYGCPTSF